MPENIGPVMRTQDTVSRTNFEFASRWLWCWFLEKEKTRTKNDLNVSVICRGQVQATNSRAEGHEGRTLHARGGGVFWFLKFKKGRELDSQICAVAVCSCKVGAH